MSDAELDELKRQHAKLSVKLKDLEQRIQRRQGLPVADPAQRVPSSTETPYQRQTRPLRWSIHCALCDREGVEAIRYPGPPPSICDECYAQFSDDEQGHQDARNAAKKADRQRAKAGQPPRRPAERLEDDGDALTG